MRHHIVCAMALLWTGCVGEQDEYTYQTELLEDGQTERVVDDLGRFAAGALLFNRVEFQGNGRTCSTCHIVDEGGTIDPAFVDAAFQADPHDALFVDLDSDDRNGATFDRVRTEATILIDFDLPDGLFICGDLPSDCVCNNGQCVDSGITHLVIPRATTSTMNNPGLETRFMSDGRFTDLQTQAHGAINQHYEPGRQPTALELDLIAEFQQRNPRFYSSTRLYLAGQGVASVPALPAGHTKSEKRGRKFFENTPDGLCGHCHGGPMLNTSTENLLAPPFLMGVRTMQLAQVSLINPGGKPVHTYCFDDAGTDANGAFDVCADPFFADIAVGVPASRANPFGGVPAVSSDPGLVLTTGQPLDFSAFRIPTLWGVADTAPYFHDNSAEDLEAMMDHYRVYFAGPPANRVFTDQEVADIIAYLKLLK